MVWVAYRRQDMCTGYDVAFAFQLECAPGSPATLRINHAHRSERLLWKRVRNALAQVSFAATYVQDFIDTNGQRECDDISAVLVRRTYEKASQLPKSA